jgi:hypothetical protein
MNMKNIKDWNIFNNQQVMLILIFISDEFLTGDKLKALVFITLFFFIFLNYFKNKYD